MDDIKTEILIRKDLSCSTFFESQQEELHIFTTLKVSKNDEENFPLQESDSSASVEPSMKKYQVDTLEANEKIQAAICQVIDRSDKIRKFQCHLCDYCASKASRLKQHIKDVHDKIKDFQCIQCSYGATDSTTLRNHIKIVHDNIRPFRCTECDYSTSTAYNLKRHFKAVHANTKDFKCRQCSYATSKAVLLKCHIKIVHEKKRDFKCSRCDYSSCRLQNVRHHERTIHDKIKDFKCQHCDYASSNIGNLKKHIKTKHANVKDPLKNDDRAEDGIRQAKDECKLCSLEIDSEVLQSHLQDEHFVSVEDYEAMYTLS